MTATTSSSPWSREAAPSVTLPPPPPPPQAPPGPPHHVQVPPRPTRGRFWVWVPLVLLLVVAVSGGVSAAITYFALNGARSSSTSTPPPAVAPTSPTTPRFSAAEAAAAKERVCQVFDVSVRGQQGQGGLRVEGVLNIPVVLRALNSASVVQNALVPAVPADITMAARSYLSATLDQTTAAMGNTSTSEGNRLTDIRNEAMYALLDACGLPR